MRALVSGIALLIALAAPAAGVEVYCRDTGHLDWVAGKTFEYTEGEGLLGGQLVIGIDLETGEYREHQVGSRAWITGGGTLKVVRPGNEVAREPFIGVDPLDGSTMHIMYWHEDKPYVRLGSNGAVGYGRCDLESFSELDP